MNGICKAQIEFERSRRALAWSPISHVAHKSCNQHWLALSFADGSRLEMFASGAAQWTNADGSRSDYAEAHHYCNAFAH